MGANGAGSFQIPTDLVAQAVNGYDLLVQALTIHQSGPLPQLPWLYLASSQLVGFEPVQITLQGLNEAGLPAWMLSFLLSADPRPQDIPTAIPSWAWQLDQWRSTPLLDRGARPADAPTFVPGWYWDWASWHRQPFTVLLGQQ
jgi:hypothetical protein